MTGGGKGYCMVRVPGPPDEAITGFSGLAGNPLILSADSPREESASLRFRLLQVQLALRELDRRASALEGLAQANG